jgi:hypothetical protein
MTQQGKQDQPKGQSQQGSTNAQGDKTAPNKQMQGGTHAGQTSGTQLGGRSADESRAEQGGMGSTDGRVDSQGGLGSPERSTSQERSRGGQMGPEGGSTRRGHA